MSAIGVPPNGGLPFKRTAKRKSIETPEQADAIDLFRHSDRFLVERVERQRKQAAGKAAKREKKRKENLAKEDDKDAEEQLFRESGEPESSSSKKRRVSEQRRSRRQHLSLSDADDDDELPSSRPLSSRKSSQISVTTPSRTTRANHPAKRLISDKNVISLDDSDDDDYNPTSSAKGKKKMRNQMTAEDEHIIKENPDSDSDPIEVDEPVLDANDPTAKYIKEARERMAQNKAERLARENGETVEAAAELLIDSRLEGITPLKIKIYVTQRMEIVKDAWVLKNIQRLVPVSKSVMQDMFFTWKGRILYNHTTLASLGIKPDSNGNLYPSWEGSKEGFKDCNKVYIEAWTSKLYKENEEALDREQRRKRGEFDSEHETEPEPEPEPAKDERIKVILRSKDHGEQNLKVPPNCEVKYLIKAFRTLKKIPEDKSIEMQFDGEMLDADSTIDNYGIEDMEKVDVYVK